MASDYLADPHRESDPSFRCIGGWPDATRDKKPPLALRPSVKWKQLIVSGYAVLELAAADSGIVASQGKEAVAVDASGTIQGTYGPLSMGFWTSSPVGTPFGYTCLGTWVSVDCIDGKAGPVVGRYISADRGVSKDANGPFARRGKDLVGVSRDDRVIRIDLDAGDVWSTPLPQAGAAWNVLMAVGDTIFVSDYGTTRAIDFATGADVGSLHASDGAAARPVLVTETGIVAVVDRSPTSSKAYGSTEVLGFDRCGMQEWSLPGTMVRRPTVVDAAGRIVVGERPVEIGSAQDLVAYSPDGVEIGRARDIGTTRAMAVGSDGAIYGFACRGADSALIALSEDLKIAWELPVDGTCDSFLAASLDVKGVLYALQNTGDKRVAAFQTTSDGPAASEWPQELRDQWHTMWAFKE